ncbi:MAG TPA: leucine--tRNA ligase [Candidatus Saccharimonadales bacterium]
MKRYSPLEIEAQWQREWQSSKLYEVTEEPGKDKVYAVAMFPYPSGAGLHVGHVRNYSISDVIARFHRQRGKNVLSAIGWDTFGLPAENYAIKTGISPVKVTKTNIANFKTQLSKLGMSYDWSREVNTSDPEYYRWTQWIFTKLFEHGLAYQKQSAQWWCPVDKTVLANEQVEGGKCWRCGSVVTRKSMKQWFFKITEYADALLEGIDDLDWPDKIRTAQRNWIGRSEGAEIKFAIDGGDQVIPVFTTRPDTLFGATFLVLAPEHPQVAALTAPDAKEAVEAYILDSQKKSDIERMNESREKTGVPTGAHAINPATGEKIPVWIADYVLTGYGTGAIMAVPAHDGRDFAFAEAFNLPIKAVIEKPTHETTEETYAGEGILINSGAFTGMRTEEAREEIVAWLQQRQLGESKINYRMRDWLISRQRYWGVPIPIVHCEKHGAVPVPESQLPVVLPEIDDYLPSDDGRSALAKATDWVHTTCPTCGGPAMRETDTMDGYACSSWYLLRYTDPRNSTAAWSENPVSYWLPVDYYCGGDHAVSHLLYTRFWSHVFNDMGLLATKEPIKQLVYNGYINAADGQKMSKSKGNVVDPIELVDQGYGADALRVYELFIGPYELDAAWDPRGITGTYRFLNRVWVLLQEYHQTAQDGTFADTPALQKITNKTIRKVTDDLDGLRFNTAIAALMEFVNELYKLKLKGMQGKEWRDALEALLQLLAPFAPHITEELWSQLGHADSIHTGHWPVWDESVLKTELIEVAIQVNGKFRGKVQVPEGANEAQVMEIALTHEQVSKYVAGASPKRTIYVPNRLLNIVL